MESSTATSAGFISRLLSHQSLLIAAAPAFAYCSAYLYELGYALHFGMPSSLIRVDFSNFMVAAGGLLFVFFILFQVFNMLTWLPKSDHPAYFMLKRLVPLYLLVLAFGLIHRDWARVFPSLVGAIVLTALDLRIPLLLTRGKRSYREKLDESLKQEAKQKGPYDWVFGKIGRAPVIALLLVLYSLYFAYSMGGSNARRQTNFLVVPESNRVVLRIYSDTVVLVDYEETSRTTGRTFFLQKLRQDGEAFELREIGPLASQLEDS